MSFDVDMGDGDMPKIESFDDLDNDLIPWMERRGFLLEVVRHNPKWHSTGWAAKFVVPDSSNECETCSEEKWDYGDFTHSGSIIAAVDEAASRALTDYVMAVRRDPFI